MHTADRDRAKFSTFLVENAPQNDFFVLAEQNLFRAYFFLLFKGNFLRKSPYNSYFGVFRTIFKGLVAIQRRARPKKPTCSDCTRVAEQ